MGCSIVETFSKDIKPKELEEVLRLEYRSKLLNPKWAQVRLPLLPVVPSFVCPTHLLSQQHARLIDQEKEEE